MRAQTLTPLSITTGLTVWTRPLAGLVPSGLPLERAITALTDKAETGQQRNPVAFAIELLLVSQGVPQVEAVFAGSGK